MSATRHTETAFETVIEAYLLSSGYVALAPEGFDRERAIFPGDRARVHPRHPADGMGKARGTARREDRRAGPRRPVQMDGRERLARDAAPRFQVLRPHAARRVLQGGPRAEPGTGGALRGEPPRAYPAAPLLAPVGEVARRDAEPQRHPRRHGGTEEPADGPDGGGRASAVPAATAIRANRSSSSSAARSSTSRSIPRPCS